MDSDKGVSGQNEAGWKALARRNGVVRVSRPAPLYAAHNNNAGPLACEQAPSDSDFLLEHLDLATRPPLFCRAFPLICEAFHYSPSAARSSR